MREQHICTSYYEMKTVWLDAGTKPPAEKLTRAISQLLCFHGNWWKGRFTSWLLHVPISICLYDSPSPCCLLKHKRCVCGAGSGGIMWSVQRYNGAPHHGDGGGSRSGQRAHKQMEGQVQLRAEGEAQRGYSSLFMCISTSFGVGEGHCFGCVHFECKIWSNRKKNELLSHIQCYYKQHPMFPNVSSDTYTSSLSQFQLNEVNSFIGMGNVYNAKVTFWRFKYETLNVKYMYIYK